MLNMRVESPQDGHPVWVAVLRIGEECRFDADAILDLFGYGDGEDAELALVKAGGPGLVLTRKLNNRTSEHRRFLNIAQAIKLARGSDWEEPARRRLGELCERMAARMEVGG